MIKNKFIKSPLKYTGSKYTELDKFIHLFPSNIETFYEPFVGGGSVFLNTKAKKYRINDFDEKIFSFWDTIARSREYDYKYEFVTTDEQQDLIHIDEDLCSYEYALFNEYNKLITLNKKRFYYPSDSYKILQFYPFNDRSKKFIEKNNINCQDKLRNIAERDHQASIYYEERKKYNMVQSTLSSTFWINEFSYCGLSRYNSKGEYNVPYGGLSYNKKNILPKIHQLLHIRDNYNFDIVQNLDFEMFFSKEYGSIFNHNDFIFLDPPYTTSFSSYGNNTFSKEDHLRLKNILKDVNCKFLMVINFDKFTQDLYDTGEFKTAFYDKKYKVNIKGRMKDNNKIHMIVKNY